MRIQVLHASVNPQYYDTKELAKMDYNSALNFFENDGINACRVEHHDIDATEYSEHLFAPDGIQGGDDSDTSLVWLKVTPFM